MLHLILTLMALLFVVTTLLPLALILVMGVAKIISNTIKECIKDF